jgi:hypothetical protein
MSLKDIKLEENCQKYYYFKSKQKIIPLSPDINNGLLAQSFNVSIAVNIRVKNIGG